MALPWLAALAVEWALLSGSFKERARARPARPPVLERPAVPWFALAVVAADAHRLRRRLGLGVELVWIAAAGALVLALHSRPPARELVGSAEPGFLVFVLGLGVVVQAASAHGLGEPPTRWSPTAPGCRRCSPSPPSPRSPRTSSTTCRRR